MKNGKNAKNGRARVTPQTVPSDEALVVSGQRLMKRALVALDLQGSKHADLVADLRAGLARAAPRVNEIENTVDLS